MDLPVPPPLQRAGRAPSRPWGRKGLALAPALAAMAYPLWLQAFHALAVRAPGEARGPAAWLPLAGAFAMPGLAAASWLRTSGRAPGCEFERRTRRLALLGVAAPPLFVAIAFVLGVLGHPVPEPAAWMGAWVAAGLWAWTGRRTADTTAPPPADTTARVAHGVVAALLLAFIGFHLANHLVGLAGPQAHAAVMRWGRQLYRLPAVEALLVVLMLLQLGLGFRLAARWSLRPLDMRRALQVASGVYLGLFALTHMNSALVSARLLHGWPTDWGWASGAPTGLLLDGWNIRLLPHYGLGVFCVLVHLACGLRGVLLAHGWRRVRVDRAWAIGVAGAALVSATIVAALCGWRLSALP